MRLGTQGDDLIFTNGYDLIVAKGGADEVNAQGGNYIVLAVLGMIVWADLLWAMILDTIWRADLVTIGCLVK